MKVLLNDASVLLNLLATGCFESISTTAGWQFAICPAVRDESKKLRDPATGELADITIEPFIQSGMLRVLELSGEEEQDLYVEQTASVDDGEAMSIVIAASRSLDLAMDDRQASSHTRRRFPQIRLWTTPEILKRWADVTRPSEGQLKQAIMAIETRARYFPRQSHSLFGWWRSSRDGD